MSRTLLTALVALVVSAAGCGSAGPVYPSRPDATPGEPQTDPTPSRVVIHATITSKALHHALEESVPRTGEGTFPMLGSERKFTWRRGTMAIRFQQGRIGLDLHVDAVADMPVGSLDIPLDVRILAEPIITSEYAAKLQSLDVQVTSQDRIIRVADAAADVLPKIKAAVEGKLKDFAYDLYPTIAEAHMRVARPVELPLGDASGCAVLKVVGIEAGPTVLADGIEKDLAIIVAPSVTLPCSPPELGGKLPPLANVASVPSGPFSVTVPVAARYEELTKAMTLAFTDGKLFFSKEYPQLYLEKPEVYAAKDQLVLKLHLAGPVSKYGIDTTLDGDLYLTGHPVVEDNELRIPDLEPTIETKNFFLKLKASMDSDNIRDQARAALRLDIGERLKAVKQKLSSDISFGNGQGCLKAEAHKIEVAGVHVHGSYLRVYVNANASASMYMPCP
jgi:predicted small lipoprotein YifL